jgi:hypothetical protein
VSIGATLTASLLAVLERPSTWLLALVGFLVRGGWLIVLAPIVVLPTAVGIANVIAPLLEDVAFGRRTGDVITVSLASLAVVVAWLVGGGLLAAATEVEIVGTTAGVIGEPAVPPARLWHKGWGVLLVRLVALVPLGIALGYAAVRVVGVGYRELTNPSDVAMPVAYRILAGAPDAVLAVILALLVGEIVGAVAARRVILSGDGVRAALREAIRYVRRAPGRSIGLALTSAVALIAVLTVTSLGTSTGWDALRTALANGDASVGTSLILVLFVALFAGSLILLGLTSAWRSAIWTIEVADPDGRGTTGTFGGGEGSQSGD